MSRHCLRCIYSSYNLGLQLPSVTTSMTTMVPYRRQLFKPRLLDVARFKFPVSSTS